MAEAKKTTKKTKEEEKAELEAIKQTAKKVVEKEAKEIVEEAVKEEKTTAKAGKRSAKALAEAEEKAAKEVRKASDTPAEKPKQPVTPTRSRLERRSKKYKDAAKLIDKSKTYSFKEALELACKTSTTKFDATVELHVRLGVDPRQADQNIRDNVVLPAGTGKEVRVAVFAEDDTAKEALKAGAVLAGVEEVTKALDKGQIEFDVLIAPPSLMAKLAKYARVLGPKGLMPNPKSGTVTADVVKGVEAAKAGRIEYRVDSTGIIHVAVGKVSFGADKLNTNVDAIKESIKQNKPSSLKSTYVRSISITTSMGPGIPVNISEI